MKRTYRIILLILLIILCVILAGLINNRFRKDSFLGSQSNTNTNVSMQAITKPEITENNVETEINSFRQKNGKSQLTRYEPLCDLAKIRVYEVKTDWSHKGFEARGDEIYQKFCSSEKTYCESIAENLAKGDFGNAGELVEGWANSSGHRANMMGDFNVQCVAESENHYVSLFAKITNEMTPASTETNVTGGTSGTTQTTNQTIPYSYEKVRFWEQRKAEDEKYKNNWKSAYNNPQYNKDDLNDLIDLFDKKIDIAGELWDDYTNSKATQTQINSLENKYWDTHNKTAKLSKELNQSAYETCRDYWKDLESKNNKDYSENINDCNNYLD